MKADDLSQPLLVEGHSPGSAMPSLSLSSPGLSLSSVSASPATHRSLSGSATASRSLRKTLTSPSLYLLAGVALSHVGERTSFKFLVDSIPAHTFAAGVYGLLLIFLVSASGLAWKCRRTAEIIPEVTDFHKGNFFVMALLDSAQFLLLIGAGSYVPPTLSVLLLQAFLPVTLVGSVILFRTQYSWTHWVGATIVLGAVVVGLLPMWHPSTSSADSTAKMRKASFAYVGAALPAALSGLFKERALRDKFMDPFYLMTWVTAFEAIIFVVAGPFVMYLQGVGAGFSFGDLAHALKQGGDCLFLHKGTEDDCYCNLGLVLLVLYLGTSTLFYTLLPIAVLRMEPLAVYRAAAVGAIIAMFVLAFPSQPCKSSPLEESWSPPITDWLSLLGLALGFAVYYAKDEPGGEYITIADDYPEGFTYRAPVRVTPENTPEL